VTGEHITDLQTAFSGLKTDSAEYAAAVRNFIVAEEGSRLSAYSDATGEDVSKILKKSATINGKPVDISGRIEGNRIISKHADKGGKIFERTGYITIGQGFNMQAPGAGDALEAALKKDAPDFDQLLKGEVNLTAEQVSLLTDHSLAKRRETVKKIGPEGATYGELIAKLPESQQAPVLATIESLHYNLPALVRENTNFYKALAKYAGGDDSGLRDALVEVKYNSNAASNDGIQNRRNREAELLNVKGWDLERETLDSMMFVAANKPVETAAEIPEEKPGISLEEADKKLRTAIYTVAKSDMQRTDGPNPKYVKIAGDAEAAYRKAATDAGIDEKAIDNKITKYRKEAQEIYKPNPAAKKEKALPPGMKNAMAMALDPTYVFERTSDNTGLPLAQQLLNGIVRT